MLEKNELKWEKMAGITTDGSASNGREEIWPCYFCVSEKSVNVEEKLLSTTAFCIKNNYVLNLSGLWIVMRDVVKIVNNIRSRALSHRQFKALMDEMDAQYGDVLYHQEVRWLSRGKFSGDFLICVIEIRVFQESKDGNIQVPTDKKNGSLTWLSL